MSAESRAPVLELQIHSPDIRRGVRSRFIDVADLVATAAILGSVLLWLAWSMAVMPRVVRSVWMARAYEREVEARAELGARLGDSVERLEGLRERAAEVGQRVEKVHLAYGLAMTGDGEDGITLRSTGLSLPAESIFASTAEEAGRLAGRVAGQLRAIEVRLSAIQEHERGHREQARTVPAISPVERSRFVLTSPYGARRNPFTRAVDFHSGIDLAALAGTPIRAPGDGVVVFAGRVPLRRSVSWWRFGKLVVLRHGERFVTLFGHCEELRVSRGETVERGEVIATVGNTGWSTNPHLHYEVRRRIEGGEFRPVDPRIYILDERWNDEERLLVSARRAPATHEYEPLPPVVER